MKFRKRLKRFIKRSARKLIINMAGLTVLLLIFTSLVYGPPLYVLRALFRQDSGVYDYKFFSNRPLFPADEKYRFSLDLDERRVKFLFESDSRIKDLEAYLAENRTQAFIVIQNDRILYEKYFGGAQRDTVVTSFSIAKSFTSALIGIAIDKKYIKSVDDSITLYLPELLDKDRAFSKITIDHLLLMTSGLKFKKTHFLDGDEVKIYYHPNLRKLVRKEVEILSSPGESFLYNHYNPLLLGMILERATGMSVTEFLQKNIWDQLGMEYGGSWSLDSRAGGFEKMETGINGRAIDFAKMGRLFLNGGNWNGKQVISADWVKKSITPIPPDQNKIDYPNWFLQGPSQYYYKYMWWGLQRNKKDFDFFGEGDKGQYLYVSPAKNLIIVRHGEEYGSGDWSEILFEAASRF